jgi:hypothetical protein
VQSKLSSRFVSVQLSLSLSKPFPYRIRLRCLGVNPSRAPGAL